MKSIYKILLITLIFILLGSPAYALVSSTSLIENANKYSGKEVVYQGEAIGDVMKRGKYGWVNLHDGSNAIGVWAPVDMLNKIEFVGDYNHIGDMVLVEGIYSQACTEHGGDIDIHAKSLTIIKTGRKVSHPINKTKASIAGVLFLLAVIVFMINRYQKRHFVASS